MCLYVYVMNVELNMRGTFDPHVPGSGLLTFRFRVQNLRPAGSGFRTADPQVPGSGLLAHRGV